MKMMKCQTNLNGIRWEPTIEWMTSPQGAISERAGSIKTGNMVLD